MSLEKMKVFAKFPAPKKITPEEMTRLVRWIEVEIYTPIVKRLSFLQDRILTGGFEQDVQGGIEIILEGNVAGDDGNWQLVAIDGNFIIRKRVSGSWEKARTILGS